MTAACGLCERDLEDGYLCPGDMLGLAERLERMPRLYEALAGFLTPAARGLGEAVSRGPAVATLPVDETVLDLRYGGIALVLESWLSAVQEARGWGQPAVQGSPEGRVHRAARSLGANLEWIAAAYPAAGDLAREVRELELAARSIVGDPAPRPQRLGTCVAVDGEGVVCGAEIRRLPGQSRVACRWCGYRYESEQDWLTLLHFQPKEAA